jgi:poly-beta-1,6-N-acetyl-D-glucosamine synthase
VIEGEFPYIYQSNKMYFFSIIFLLILAFYGVLIAYYHRAWNAIGRDGAEGADSAWAGKDSPPQGSGKLSGTMISVLVPARNEEANIGACLESLFRQTYPKDRYEVIVIDDHSVDQTASIVRGYDGQQAGDFSVVYIDLAAHVSEEGPVRAHKKFAIETGIRYAKGDLIITTDADCRSQPGWLQAIAKFHEESGAKFIAAPVKIEGSRAFLSIFQTLDFITLQGITGAAVYKKIHSMCNGANLAYDKKAFYEVGGFRGIDAIPSGDDMLLMHKVYKRYPGLVFFLKHPQAIVSTNAETGWRGFVNQRIRWASKADQYDDKRIFRVLLLVYIMNLLFLGLVFASFWNSWFLWLLLIGLFIKTVVEYPFVRSVAGFFGQGDLMVYFPWLQPFHILYTVVIGWLGKFGSYRWKDRKINK